MASPTKHEDRLDALAADIQRLRIDLVASVRAAGELLNGEDEAIRADERVKAIRLLLEAKKDLYLDESEAMRAKRCPIHGVGKLIVACPQCCEAWGYQLARSA